MNLIPPIAAFIFFFIPSAMAYVGPGPGLTMLGSFFALVGGIFLALFMVALYPIRLWLKRRKQGGNKSDPGNPVP